MHIGIISTKVIDQEQEPASPEVKNAKGKVVKKATKEKPEKSHMEIGKIFMERSESEVAKNKALEHLEFYEVSGTPEKAIFTKVK